MRIIGLIMGMSLVTLGTLGQNRLDEQGRKTGPWRVEYPNGNTLYEGAFVEGKPVGEMTRYYESGAVRARITFGPVDGWSRAVLYYKSGKPAAEGIYRDEMKDSVWTYYSELDGSVRIREKYRLGKLEGISRRYYDDGKVSEEILYEGGMKQGPWTRYYENGDLRLEATYRDDKLEGTYRVWSPGKVPLMEGQYREGQSSGTWNYYDEKGDLLYSLEYRNGFPVDREKYLKLMQDTVLRADSIMQSQPGQPF
jgi:antitoxin component YwqK of YwqJK toxin-antitoxin module